MSCGARVRNNSNQEKSPQYGEKLNHNDDVVPEPQVEISDKSRSADYSNRGEKTGVMRTTNIQWAVPS